MRAILANRILLRCCLPTLFRRNAHGGHGHVAFNPGPPVNADYISVPFQPYKTIHGQLQSKFNMYLGISTVLFVISFIVAAADGVFMLDAMLAPHSYRYRHKTAHKV